MSRIANNALLGGGVRVRVWIREQRKIKGRSKALLSLCWQSWTSLGKTVVIQWQDRKPQRCAFLLSKVNKVFLLWGKVVINGPACCA